MAIARVQEVVKGGNAASATTLVLTLGAVTTAVGNRLILSIVHSAVSITGVTDSKGNTWAVDVTKGADLAGNAGASIASTQLGTALVNGDTITITASGSSRLAGYCYEYSGILAGGPDKTASASDGTTAGTASNSGATATTTQADELVIGATGISASHSAFAMESLAPAWTTEGSAASSGTIRTIYHADRIVTATGAYSAKATWTTSRNWTAAIATYKAASSAAVLAGAYAGVAAWAADVATLPKIAGSSAGVSAWTADLTIHSAGSGAALAGPYAGVSSWVASLTAPGPPFTYLGRLRNIQYHAMIFSPDANGGPGLAKYELDADMLNVTWQQGLNFPGQAAFSLARFNKKLSNLLYMQDHIKIYREGPSGTKIVFAGKIVKPSETAHDTIVYCWDYLAFLQRSRTGYRTLYPEKTIKEIVDAEWGLAKAAGTSLFTFVTTGTTEAPLGQDAVTIIKTNNQFGVIDFDRLYLFNALAEIGMANTSNTVVFEITRDPPHTFNFWKNRSVVRGTYHFNFPGNLIDYDLDDGTDQIVNDLATVLLDSTTGAQVEYALADATSIATYRRLQAATTIKTLFGITSGTTESDQQKAALARMLTISAGIPRLITAFPRQGELEAFDNWSLGDSFRVSVQKADRTADRVDAYMKMTGIAAAWTPEAGELMQVFLR